MIFMSMSVSSHGFGSNFYHNILLSIAVVSRSFYFPSNEDRLLAVPLAQGRRLRDDVKVSCTTRTQLTASLPTAP